MKKKIFSFLITNFFFFQYLLSIYIILYILITNIKKIFNKKINVLVLSKDRFDKVNLVFDKTNKYNLLYLPVKIQSILLTKWQSKLDFLSKKNLKSDKGKINFLNKNNTEIKKIRKEYLKIINRIFPLVFRILKIQILFSGSVHYLQDHDIATIAKNKNIPFVVFHRENIFFTKKQIEQQKKQYENYLISNADLIFVNNEDTKDIIQSTIGKKSEVIIIQSLVNTKTLKHSKNIKNYITLFSFTDNYGLGALNYFSNSVRWHSLFQIVHLNFLKLVDKYPNENFRIKVKWSGGWLMSVKKIWFENFNKKFPDNLKVLNENYDSHNIIKNSKFIIAFNSTAILEAGLANKEVIIPNFAECKDKEVRKYSFGNLKKTKLYFNVAETEKEFVYLIENKINKKNNYSKLGAQKKIFINSFINPYNNFTKLVSQINFHIDKKIQNLKTKNKLVEKDLCFFVKPKFYHMENVLPVISFLKLNYRIKNKIQIVLSREEDYEYLKSTQSVYNITNKTSKIDYLSSNKNYFGKIKNLFFYFIIFSKKRTFYVYKPSKIIQIFLKINRFIFSSTVNYYLLNYHNISVSKSTIDIFKSINSYDTIIADNIITNIPINYFNKKFYSQNRFKFINLKLSRFSDFWIKEILMEEKKIRTLIPKKSIFFPLAVLERKLYHKNYDFKLIINKILFCIKEKYKNYTVVFRPHPTTDIKILKNYLNKIKFKNYKILYNHYYYLISKSQFSVRYLSSTIDISHAILNKNLFRFYPKELIYKDKMIHEKDKILGYDNHLNNIDYLCSTRKILKFLAK